MTEEDIRRLEEPDPIMILEALDEPEGPGVMVWLLGALFLAFLLVGWAVLAQPAEPRTACADRATVVRMLAVQFHEWKQAHWLDGGVLYEFWANPLSGTGTVLQTKSNGMVCIIASGDRLEYFAPPALVVEDKPA